MRAAEKLLRSSSAVGLVVIFCSSAAVSYSVLTHEQVVDIAWNDQIAPLLRQRFPQIRARRWLDGRRVDGSYGVLWLTPSADEMKEEDWKFPEGRFLAYVLGPIEHGKPPIFIVLNAAPEAITFTLPKMAEYKGWQQLLNTADVKQTVAEFASGSETTAPPRSVLAFAGST